MRRRAGWACALGMLALSASGCPLTDDYYVDAATGGSAATGASAATGGSADAAGSVADGGASSDATGGAVGSSSCTAAERCNGRDDDCDGEIDGAACAPGCSGFVLTDRTHGYMFCSEHLDWTKASAQCAGQGQHLAWIENKAENIALGTAVDALTDDSGVYIGASDAVSEGAWTWTSRVQFWTGTSGGTPVGGAFVLWSSGQPDNNRGGEDCAVMRLPEQAWDDRSCSGTYAYVCEEP